MHKAKSPINRQSAPSIIRLLDYCYKQGVVDASEAGDDIAVKEWYDSVMTDRRYGLVGFDGETEKCDWRRWRFFLFRWCRNNRMTSLGYNYIDDIRKPNGICYVIIPVSMMFYLRGVNDWLKYPNEANLAIFTSRPRVLWKESASEMTKLVNTKDYILAIQEIIYDLRSRPFPGMKYITERMLSGFEYAMWQVTSPIRGRIR